MRYTRIIALYVDIFLVKYELSFIKQKTNEKKILKYNVKMNLRFKLYTKKKVN